MSMMIRNMSEMTDSREVLESKTNPFITCFLLLVFLLIATGLVWSFFGEIDETAKAAAVVRSNEKVSTLQAPNLGKVTSVLVSEGKGVFKGEALITLDTEDLNLQLNNRKAEVDKTSRKLSFLERYRQSVTTLKNAFLDTDPEEAFYYDGVEQFLLEYQQLEYSLTTVSLELTAAINNNNGSQNSIENDLQSGEEKIRQEVSELEREISLLQVELNHEELLARSVASNKNLLSTSDPKRSRQFEVYSIKYSQLLKAADEKEADYKRSLELGDRLVSGIQLEEALQQVEFAFSQVEQARQEMLLGVESNVASIKQQLTELQNKLNLLNKQSDAAYLNLQALRLQRDNLATQMRDLEDREKLSQNSQITSLNKLKADKVVQIGTLIEAENEKLKSLNDNVRSLQFQIEEKTLKAPIDGTINVVKEVNVGDLVQPGESLLAIIPLNESIYKMSLAVPNSEAGKIRLGDTVNFNFSAFPKQSFGSLSGTVTTIGTDSIVQQDGLSYYLVEAALPNKQLVNRQGERGEVRLGMTANAYVITDTKRIFDFILEKINLKE